MTRLGHPREINSLEQAIKLAAFLVRFTIDRAVLLFPEFFLQLALELLLFLFPSHEIAEIDEKHFIFSLFKEPPLKSMTGKTRRLCRVEKAKIVKMAMSGCSLTEISKASKLKKTTVYYWVRKTLGKRIRDIIVNERDMETVGEIIGAFAGDGSANVDKNYQYVIRFSLSKNERKYAQRIISLLKSVYGVKPWICKSHVITLKTERKKILQHLENYLQWDKNQRRTYTTQLKKKIDELDRNFLIGFIRGVFDTEGFINIAKRYVGICVTSEGLANDVSNALTKIGITHRWYEFTPTPPRRRTYEVRIVMREALEKFNKVIGFGNPLKEIKLGKVLRPGLSGFSLLNPGRWLSPQESRGHHV